MEPFFHFSTSILNQKINEQMIYNLFCILFATAPQFKCNSNSVPLSWALLLQVHLMNTSASVLPHEYVCLNSISWTLLPPLQISPMYQAPASLWFSTPQQINKSFLRNRCSVVSNLFSLGAVLLASSSGLAEISLHQLLRQEPQRAEAEHRQKRISAQPYQTKLMSDHK